jgi:hypothetical protein
MHQRDQPVVFEHAKVGQAIRRVTHQRRHVDHAEPSPAQPDQHLWIEVHSPAEPCGIEEAHDGVERIHSVTAHRVIDGR